MIFIALSSTAFSQVLATPVQKLDVDNDQSDLFAVGHVRMCYIHIADLIGQYFTSAL